ncbi:MAG: hypothetical protein WD294_10415 [Phycisphaeraceae bacterium]
MVRFSNDADLLAYEPNVFVDLPLAAQRRLRAEDVVVSGTSVAVAAGGLSSLAQGDVVVLGREPGQWTAYAIDQIVDDQALTLGTAAIGFEFEDGDPVAMEVRTFSPQAELVHEELLRAVGIDVEDVAAGLDADAVLSVSVMRRLEVLGTLSSAYAAGVGIAGEQALIEAKAARYHKAFSGAMRSARVLIDTDGDGRADVWRTPGVARIVRG